MTFSDKKVAGLVNANFVAAWTNRGPGFHNEDYSAEQWIFTEHMEAYPTKNICTFFLTPGGKVFHYLAGYFAPETFCAELELAVALRREAFDGKMALKADGAGTIRSLHAREAERLKERVSKDLPWDEVSRFKAETYREFKHRHNASCVAAILEGDRYRAALHRHWSGVQALPALEEVRLDYLYGNSFTEEPRRGASLVQGRCVAGE